MISHQINRDAVDRMIHHFVQVANGQNTADVLIAVGEFIGRAIVAIADTPISGTDMARILEDHLKRTLEAGFSAKGYNMGAGL